MESKKTIKQLVEIHLRKHKAARDCDGFMLATFWHYEREKKGISKADFLKELSKGVFTPAVSIVRYRRELQKEFKELEGTRREDRTDRLEKEFRKEFKPKN